MNCTLASNNRQVTAPCISHSALRDYAARDPGAPPPLAGWSM
jgi:hypothetical protein